ncbi:hypothetical protein [[Clostridium] innocuum]|uniref:hypothetical protein n=1 Tax=Clostridium innocuum TaxID=1522 RepID=UPI001158623B|nr:hypothetical protein [[Clostridium] innocuum]
MAKAVSYCEVNLYELGMQHFYGASVQVAVKGCFPLPAASGCEAAAVYSAMQGYSIIKRELLIRLFLRLLVKTGIFPARPSPTKRDFSSMGSGASDLRISAISLRSSI